MIHLTNKETIILEARKHWFLLFLDFVVLLVMIVVPPIAYLLWILFSPISFPIPINGDSFSFALFIYLLWLMGAWISFFTRWTDYYLDVWYVTPRKILHVEQKGLFHREVSSVRYEKIQDITVETKGIIATLLNFGDVHVQTAGEVREIILRSARHPNRLKKAIMREHHRVIGENPNEV